MKLKPLDLILLFLISLIGLLVIIFFNDYSDFISFLVLASTVIVLLVNIYFIRFSQSKSEDRFNRLAHKLDHNQKPQPLHQIPELVNLSNNWKNLNNKISSLLQQNKTDIMQIEKSIFSIKSDISGSNSELNYLKILEKLNESSTQVEKSILDIKSSLDSNGSNNTDNQLLENISAIREDIGDIRTDLIKNLKNYNTFSKELGELKNTPKELKQILLQSESIFKNHINGILNTNKGDDQKSNKSQLSEPQVKIEFKAPTVFDRLKHAKKLGFNPKVIIDGGANRGKWTKWASTIFKDALFICVEPNYNLNETIKSTIGDNTKNYIIENVALGKNNDQGTLNIWGDSSGASLLDHVDGDAATKIETQIITIDALCKKHNIKPDLIKLDLQGGEMDALLGAAESLKTCEMLVPEFGCLYAYINRTSNAQMFSYLENLEYGLYDVVDIHYRPHDGALTGGDFFFVKNNSKLRSHKGYN